MPTPPPQHKSYKENFKHLLSRRDLKKQIVQTIPKQSREREAGEVRRRRKKGLCAFPGCKGHLEASWIPFVIDSHHIKTRGAGGVDGADHEIPACREHHRAAHSDPRVKAVFELMWMRMGLDFPEGYVPEDGVRSVADVQCGSIVDREKR